MKKLTTIFAALVLLFSTTASASDPGENELNSVFKMANAKAVYAADVTKAVTRAFDKKFSQAENVIWKETESLYFASFKMKENSFTAAYNNEGEMIAISRMVSLDKLPLAVADALAEKYADYVIPAKVTELSMLGETSYYLTVEGKKNYLLLKCLPGGDILVDKRVKKKVLVGKVY